MEQKKYSYPLHLLDDPDAQAGAYCDDDKEDSRKLERILRDAGVSAEVVRVSHGPSVKRYELRCNMWTHIARFVATEQTIVSGLGCSDVRLEVPIPGTPLWGIEVPKDRKGKVTLKEVLQSSEMPDSASGLNIALGRDVEGKAVICSLAGMPHLLMSGRAGSGKTTCITAMLHSLLQNAPEDVKIVLFSAVQEELGEYSSLPHMLAPVINDPHKMAVALEWAVDEMIVRYRKMREKAVYNIRQYNAAADGAEEKMSHLVIFADGLDCLMMACPQKTEEAVARIAQLGRAAGIHLVFAGQRANPNVMTGAIKDGFASRIAFSAGSERDSVHAIDQKGAEKLCFPGDMLYVPQESYGPMRVQGCCVSDEETQRVLGYMNQHFSTAYDEKLLELLAQE